MTSKIAPDSLDASHKAIDLSRAETLRLLDVVFPEIRLTLSEAEVMKALVEVEDRGMASRDCERSKVLDLNRAIAHFDIAGRLWSQRWEVLLVPAVQAKIRHHPFDGDASAHQILEAVGQVDPPRPRSDFDGLAWLEFIDNLALTLFRKSRNSKTSAPDATPSNPAYQTDFAESFDVKLKGLVAAVARDK